MAFPAERSVRLSWELVCCCLHGLQFPQALLLSIAVKEIESVEGDDSPIGMGNMNAALFHAPHIEIMCVQKLDDQDAKNILIGQGGGCLHERKAAEELPECVRAAHGRMGGGEEIKDCRAEF